MRARLVIEGLYEELRDRRLLPVVGILALAVVAVPLALGLTGSKPVSAPADDASASEAAADALEAQAAVLEETPAIRNYRKRLSRFESRNPFHQQFAGPTESEQRGAPGAPTGPGAEAPGSAPRSPSPPSPPAGDRGSGEPSGGGAGGRGGAGSRPTAGADADQMHLFSYEIDVRTGVLGSTRRVRGVEQGDPLPSVRRPVAVFLGGSRATQQAFLAISRGVDRSVGEGTCIPSPEACDFLLLGEDQGHRLRWSDGRVYRIKLSKVRLVSKTVELGGPPLAEVVEEELSPFDWVFDLLRG